MGFSLKRGQNGGQGGRRWLWIATLVLILLAAASPIFTALDEKNDLPQGDGSPQEFSAEGMTITLTNDFISSEADGYTLCYDSEKVAVLALREEFALQEGAEDYTLVEYGELVIQTNKLETALEVQNGIHCFEYEHAASKKETYHYLVTLFKTDDAFWMVQFITLTENTEDLRPSFLEWAGSISFYEVTGESE